jgi:hypothetical protein
MARLISFREFMMKREPKSVGASYHPADAAIHFSSCFLAMSSRYDILLGLIADFLIFLSGAQSFRFLLNTSYNHGATSPVSAITAAAIAAAISSTSSYSL